MAARLATGVHTLCQAWVVTRRDGEVLGFTDHDEPVTVAGAVCSPEGGFLPSTHDFTLGSATDGTDIVGALTDDRITEESVELGVWDAAAVDIYLVDWGAGEYALLSAETIAETVVDGILFEAQLRSPLAVLAEERGRLISRSCGWATFGDADCGFDLEAERIVLTVSDSGADWIEAPEIDTAPAKHFEHGVATLPGGERAQVLVQDGPRITFWRPYAADLGAGVVSVTPGCNRSPARCRQLDNEDEFGGLPFVIGPDVQFQIGSSPGVTGGVSQLRTEAPAPPTGLAASVADNTATVSFDKVALYVDNRGAGSKTKVYGTTGKIEISGLPYNASSTITLHTSAGELSSLTGTDIEVAVGDPPPPEGE